MTTVASCRSCRGKYQLLVPGVEQCEVCHNLYRVGNLVWGPRYPVELRAQAARALQTCHLQLLQEADQFYSLAEGVPHAAAAGGSRELGPQGHLVTAPGHLVAPGPPQAVAPCAPAPAKEEYNKEKKVKKEKKHKSQSVKVAPEEEQPLKEKKRHRREEEAIDKSPIPVKSESPEEERHRHGVVDLKREPVEQEFTESYESESPVPRSRSRSRSKSPLKRRLPSVGRADRPPSPPGPPPPRPPREEGRSRDRWEGPIPAGGGRRPPRPATDPAGATPKFKPQKKKKNKGKKKRERQRARAQARDRR